jgi:hypothetical protein
MSSSTVCNNDCTCINCDCSFAHPISFKDRKIVNKLFNTISNPNKLESNQETRKKNCSNGKLCIKETCGYRHRLAFTHRVKLNELFQNCKIQNIKDIKEKPKKEFKDFSINTSNLFTMLHDNDVITTEDKQVLPIILKKGFKEALIEGKKEEIKEVIIIPPKIKEVPINWADNCDSDDDFYMDF